MHVTDGRTELRLPRPR